ncbi:unnamed protein product [Caenorhabditis nigoni]
MKNQIISEAREKMRLNGSEFNRENLIESLEEDPMEVDHVEVEIMDESAYFQRPESRIVEDFEYPSQEINVENPDYHDNSDHEEEQTLTRDTLEPKFPIFESSAEDKYKSKALTQLLDDWIDEYYKGAHADAPLRRAVRSVKALE